jgi:hypothetical protein
MISPPERGCGHRVKNGIYIETPTDEDGVPVETFLICPSIPMKGPMRGQQLVKAANGVYHLIDRIGEGSYPYPSDFIEEVRRYGLSRRASISIPWHLLTQKSRIILTHPKAIVENLLDEFDPNPVPDAVCCYADKHACEDAADPHICNSWAWHYVHDKDTDRGVRDMPSFSYRPVIFTGLRPTYTEGVIGAFPVARIAIIQGDNTDELFEKVNVTNVPVIVAPF